MHSNQDGDKAFIEMMHDFVASHRDMPASTESFKAIAEKHMTRSMDVNKKSQLAPAEEKYRLSNRYPGSETIARFLEKYGSVSNSARGGGMNIPGRGRDQICYDGRSRGRRDETSISRELCLH
jgi:hypothetical protein